MPDIGRFVQSLAILRFAGEFVTEKCSAMLYKLEQAPAPRDIFGLGNQYLEIGTRSIAKDCYPIQQRCGASCPYTSGSAEVSADFSDHV
ncbi:MAG: hypothetical protein IT367_01060 [Candidatus Hydrogenedentes bacterium]|nr:hypothetical protein [Candidatus Hydrogenedentota bacterium]